MERRVLAGASIDLDFDAAGNLYVLQHSTGSITGTGRTKKGQRDDQTTIVYGTDRRRVSVAASFHDVDSVDKCDPSKADCVPAIAFTSTRDGDAEI